MDKKLKIATLVDTLHRGKSKVWCLETFTSLSGIQKVVVSTMGSMKIFEVDEECSLSNMKIVEVCEGFYNGIYYYRNPKEEKEYILVDNSHGSLFSYDLGDESVSFVSSISGSLAGYVTYQQVSERYCVLVEESIRDEKRGLILFDLERCLEKTVREDQYDKYKVIDTQKNTSEFVVAKVKLKDEERGMSLCCIRYSSRKKCLFIGGNTVYMVYIGDGKFVGEIVALESNFDERVWCMTLTESEMVKGKEFLVLGKVKGTVEVWNVEEMKMIRRYEMICRERIYRILCTGKFLIPISYHKSFVILNYVDEEYEKEPYEVVSEIEGVPYSATWIDSVDVKKKYFLVGGDPKNVVRWKSIGERKIIIDPDLRERISFIFDRIEESFLHWTIRLGGMGEIKVSFLYL